MTADELLTIQTVVRQASGAAMEIHDWIKARVVAEVPLEHLTAGRLEGFLAALSMLNEALREVGRRLPEQQETLGTVLEVTTELQSYFAWLQTSQAMEF